MNLKEEIPNNLVYPPLQKTTAVRVWMNAEGGPPEARRAKESASAETTAARRLKLHNLHSWI